MITLSTIQPWLIIGVIVVLAVIIFRAAHKGSIFSLFKNNFFYFFVFIFLAIFVISAINIHSTYSFDFKTLDGWKGLFKIYLSWLAQFVGNLAKVTGYAAQQDWIMKGNSTG